MTSGRREALLQAASIVDVLDVAGRIIANPGRYAPAASTAQTLALAHAVERLWDLCLIGQQMVIACTAEPTDEEALASQREARAADLISTFEKQMAAICGEIPPQE